MRQLTLPGFGAYTPEERAQLRFAAIQDECFTLFSLKNNQYGNNFVTAGFLGTVLELTGASQRLMKLVVKAPDHGRNSQEALRDILMDVVNYATMSLMLMKDENWEGKES